MFHRIRYSRFGSQRWRRFTASGVCLATIVCTASLVQATSLRPAAGAAPAEDLAGDPPKCDQAVHLASLNPPSCFVDNYPNDYKVSVDHTVIHEGDTLNLVFW